MTPINHITLAVSDVERSARFYRDLLGLTPVMKGKAGAYLSAGGVWFALNLDPGVLETRRKDYSHIAFSCSISEFQTLKSRLLDYGCEEWSENRSEGESFYFKDPDGHQLEIHVGSLETRLRDLKENPRDTMELY
jgi:catechol 2,3-dioxygenase-like lactoylglutathione lyase family enzyme